MRGRASAATSSVAVLRRLAPAVACAITSLLLTHCSNSRWGVAGSPRVVEPGAPVPKGGGKRLLGSAYVVGGRMYVPHYDPHYKSVGLASWYGEDFYGRYTANGEIFDLHALSAAHPTMPLPSYARVTNLANGHSLIVRVNDRGPYVSDRIIDVSVHAAELLGFYRQGTAPVRVEYVAPAPLRGSDDQILADTLRQNGPAPLPSTVRLDSRMFAATPSPPSATAAVLATAAGEHRWHAKARAVSYADPPQVANGTASPKADEPAAQFLSSRGLY